MQLQKKLVPLCAVAIVVMASLICAAQSLPEAAAMQQPQASGTPSAPALSPSVAPQAPPQVTEPGPNQPESQGSAPLRVMVDKSLLITTTDRLRRVSVTDPAIADAIVVTPTQVLVHGRAPGEVSLILWDEQERSRSFDLRVDVDVSAAAQEIKHLFPESNINVEASLNAIVLSGHVATKEDADRAGMIASAYSKNVVNVLAYGPVGAQEVLLEVKFAEIDRTAMSQFGFNLFSTGAGNVIGTTTTSQFGSFGTQTIQDQTGPRTGPFSSTETLSNVLNTFIFSPQIHLGAIIQALQEKNLLQILAEPNLIAVNGKESSFLAGGEFPFPIVQPNQGYTTVTIQFKEFGVRLKFTPLIMPNGNIHLHVAPEVSSLDYSNALTISGFVIPALSTRRADSEFEIQDGQSFVIAGLMDNNVTNADFKVPGIGDIPIIGEFFKSRSHQKTSTELMVLVTAHRISPSATPPGLPHFPTPFLDKDAPHAEKAAQKAAGGL